MELLKEQIKAANLHRWNEIGVFDGVGDSDYRFEYTVQISKQECILSLVTTFYDCGNLEESRINIPVVSLDQINRIVESYRNFIESVRRR